MWMAEVLGYDTAPMEGLYEDKVKSVLNILDSIRVIALLGVGRLVSPKATPRTHDRRVRAINCTDTNPASRMSTPKKKPTDRSQPIRS
jgi:nitroreductase